MKVVCRIIGELLLLGVIGVALGAGYNAVRASGSLEWSTAYFASASPRAGGGSTAEDDRDSVDDDGMEEYQEASIDDVVEIAGDPDALESGLYVLVDARSQDVFDDGHIEGAIRCYHYELAGCIEGVLERALGAETVIVYCNGGDCDDSKYMCQALIDRGVPYEAVYYYGGGWAEWIEQEMPVATGSE